MAIVHGDPKTGSRSDQIRRILASVDYLESLGDESRLLDVPVALAPEHQLDYALRAESGEWKLQTARLKLIEGFTFDAEVDQTATNLLAGCDGRQPLRQAIAGLAQKLQVKEEAIIPGCIQMVGEMLSQQTVKLFA